MPYPIRCQVKLSQENRAILVTILSTFSTKINMSWIQFSQCLRYDYQFMIHIVMGFVKVLFPQNQCKFSFCKFTTKSITTYISQCNKNMIHNVSDHTLTEGEFSVLTKCLSFVSTTTKNFKQEKNKSLNKFKTC